MTSDQYKAAGVDIDSANRAVEMMKQAVRATHSAHVLTDVGSFGGLYALENLPAQPVLVASTDGVGTKVKLAAQLERWEGVGQDIVNHCINDILVQNARPLFFLDYVAASTLIPAAVAGVVQGIAQACQAAGCALLGGETAEMPGVYVEGAFDVAGTVVGLVDRGALWPVQSAMQPGDLLLGLPASGPHTNGYSLIRRLIEGRDLDQRLDDGQTLADALLTPHRCYVGEVDALQAAGVSIHGLAHITGGGFYDNVPRILPDHLAAEIDVTAWRVPPVFQALLDWSGMTLREAYRVFNMGMGMIVVIPADAGPVAQSILPDARIIGHLATPRADNARVHIAPIDK
jgi:phosphoribosylformylglycinamidine cyclo-ligase